jgi:predicted helicase
MLTISPTSAAIKRYYEERARYGAQRVEHELALKTAFQSLLATLAQQVKWTLIPEEPLANGKRLDGTLRDEFHLPRGYWEAKDPHDDLTTEIRKKIALGYPPLNTIFEDTRRATLYQNGRVVMKAVDLTKPRELADLLAAFLNHAEPQIETFERAVSEFKDRIPDLARGLKQLIGKEHAESKAFQDAYAGFYALCATSIDPKVSAETIYDMLVQHMLTERLFRSVFNNPDFTQRNVIAVEIEKVIHALTSRVFDRDSFQRMLDRFYFAIEGAARSLTERSEKQAFMNMVYERFFQGYSVKDADAHGIVYTPQEIVDFMCASVEEVLQREFGTSLSAPGVQILDPCTGTGTFVVNLIRRIAGASLEWKYREDLFANEIMLLPYYIASLNIEHAYYERTGRYEPFEGVCFVDTLELEGQQMQMFTEANTERIQRQKAGEIQVIIGNPPYNAWQQNENDNNKNRRYAVIDERVRTTYVRDSRATNRNSLGDAYVKFFRWATDRLQGRDGIVCFISNNYFIDGVASDGLRKHLMQDFSQIYHLDLGGNARLNSGGQLDGNIFGIKVGVGITLAIRSSRYSTATLKYYHVGEDLSRSEKLDYLREVKAISGVSWRELHPHQNNIWLTDGLRPEFSEFIPVGAKEAKSSLSTSLTAQSVFQTYSMGVKTNRDDWVYDFDAYVLSRRIMRLIETFNSEIDRWKRAGEPGDIDGFVLYDDTQIKWSRDLKADLRRKRYAEFQEAKIRRAAYRPFTIKHYFFDPILSQDIVLQPRFYPTPAAEAENCAFVVGGYGRKDFAVIASNHISDLNFYADPTQCFPLYTYNEDGTNRRENITEWALGQFQERYGPNATRHDIFAYVYALLHHPQYRERYAENLKRELPRIPLVPDRAQYEALCRTGQALLDLHLTHEQAQEYPLRAVETPGESINWRVEKKMRLSPDKTSLNVNDSLTLEGIPAETFAYWLGNRSALEWVVDQYHVSEDARSGIMSDPNRADDPQYIVRLVKQVVTVSVETVALVGKMAREVDVLAAVGVAGE